MEFQCYQGTIAKALSKNTMPSLSTRSDAWAAISLQWSFSLYKTVSNGNNFHIPKSQILGLNCASVNLLYFPALPLCHCLSPTVLCGSSYISENSAEL